MCCFAGPREPIKVSRTNIFARFALPGAQLLVYSMTLAARSEVAMILPLPTPVGGGEGSLSFIDLKAFPKLFDDLTELFAPPALRGGPVPQGLSLGLQKLKVHKVGSFIASFVPSRRDFSRLDARFRLPDAVLEALPGAHDFGFAVFQLEKGEHTIHPMALRFQTRDPARLFFPTVHVHDGTVHPDADFDHSLFFQDPGIRVPAHGWAKTSAGDEIAGRLPTADYAGVVDKTQRVARRVIAGKHANEDTYVTI